MTAPAGLHCPGCQQPAAIVLAGGAQAFCGNDDCAVFAWNPTKTIEELAAGMRQIRLPDSDSSDKGDDQP